jgi:Ca2+:H+ antiporter
MYESTPQNVIDEESQPGPLTVWMDSSSSDDSSSSSSDSDGSSGSNTTAKRFKRVMRGGRSRRKSSAGSKDGDQEKPSPTRTSSYAASNSSPITSQILSEEPNVASTAPHRFGALDVNDDADDENAGNGGRSRAHSFSDRQQRKQKKKELKAAKKAYEKEKKKKKQNKQRAVAGAGDGAGDEINEKAESSNQPQTDGANEPRRVDFAVQPDLEDQTVDHVKRPFALRGLSSAIPKTFGQTVFSSGSPSGSPHPHRDASPAVTGPVPRVRYGIRRTNSLPDRLNQVPSGPRQNARVNSTALQSVQSEQVILNPKGLDPEEENISRTTAVVLLLVSTGLVALCAEFMVSSIDSVTSNTALGETFVGLIILPIVGNAAEHVTAVTVAHKNKMDLAIGVAVGSSIQIGESILSHYFYVKSSTTKPLTSPLRNAFRSPPRLVHGQRHDLVLHTVRDSCTLCFCLRRKLPCP